MNFKDTIIVIGGNAAGPAAAAKAKRQNPNADVILFEAGNFISTGTCELPYLLKGDIKSYEDLIFFTPETFYKEKGVKVYTKHLVENINRNNKTVSVRNFNDSSLFELSYSKLILATGSKTKKNYAISSSIKNHFYLKTVSDFLKINSFLNNNHVKNVLIIGAGYIGLETAEAFINNGISVTIVEQDKMPMPAIDNEVRALIHETLKNNDVEFIGNIQNPFFSNDSEKITNVKIEGRLREFDLILSCIGVEPNNSLALSAKLDIGNFGGIKVNNKMQTSDYNIYAAGDCIEVPNKVTGRNFYLPQATAAHSFGHIAGANAAGGNLRAEPVVENLAVKIFDRTICKVGLSEVDCGQNRFNYKTVNAVVPNLVKVMPESENVLGKIIYDRDSKLIFGASFFGGREVIGYADMISMMIQNKIKADALASVNYNYTPPRSPFVNLLSVLGRKIN